MTQVEEMLYQRKTKCIEIQDLMIDSIDIILQKLNPTNQAHCEILDESDLVR